MWKFVLKLDITELHDRTWQINKYIQQTNEMCDNIKSENHIKRTWDNLKSVINNNSNTLAKIIRLINTLYKAPSDRSHRWNRLNNQDTIWNYGRKINKRK